MGTIVDVKSIVESKKQELRKEVEELMRKGKKLKLAVILANNEEASKTYVSKKRTLCEELGIVEEEYVLEESTTTYDVLEIISKLNSDESVDGILVQLPLYKHLDKTQIIEAIYPDKDVDGFHPLNQGKLFMGIPSVVSCTPKGVIGILEALNVEIEGLNATVIGRSVIVGRPMSQLLLNKGATVTTCHSKTKDLKEHTKNADIIVVAAGKPKLITADMVKEGSIIIDVGINRIDGKICGDVDTDGVAKVAKYVTPVPGGVGLTTVVSLMQNLVELAKKRL